jgi:Tn3 transposase DDE domain
MPGTLTTGADVPGGEVRRAGLKACRTGRVAYSTVAYSCGDRRPDCGDRPAGWYDSACVLDGILGSQTDLPVTEHAVGTHGAKLANSARFDLVGLQLSSRIRDH